MATSTQRSVKRKLEAAIKRSVTGKTPRGKFKPSKATKSVGMLARLKGDKRITSAIDSYRDGVKAPEAMVAFMTRLVNIFANTAAYKAAIDDADAMAWLIGQEKDARMIGRRDNNYVLSERDKKGVAASQFKGVLRFAQHEDGGVANWNKIVAVGKNWATCKDIANTVRVKWLRKGKGFPKAKVLETLNNKIRRGRNVNARSGGGQSAGGKTNASTDTLIERMTNAAKSFDKTYAKTFGVGMLIERVHAAIKALNVATIAKAKDIAREEAKAATKASGKIKAVK